MHAQNLAPFSVAGKVRFERDVDRLVRAILQYERFAVESGREHRIGRLARMNGGILPYGAAPDRLAERPEVVDGAEPERALAVFRTHDAVGIGRRVGKKPGKDEHAAIRGVVGNQGAVGRDRPDFRESARVLRGEFVKRSGAMEEVAFGSDFAIEPADERRGHARGRFGADREPPSLSAVTNENAHRVDRTDVRIDLFGRDHIFNARDSSRFAPFEPARNAF